MGGRCGRGDVRGQRRVLVKENAVRGGERRETTQLQRRALLLALRFGESVKGKWAVEVARLRMSPQEESRQTERGLYGAVLKLVDRRG